MQNVISWETFCADWWCKKAKLQSFQIKINICCRALSVYANSPELQGFWGRLCKQSMVCESVSVFYYTRPGSCIKRSTWGHPKRIGYTMPCKLGCSLPRKMLQNNGFSINFTPTKSSKNFRCNSGTHVIIADSLSCTLTLAVFTSHHQSTFEAADIYLCWSENDCEIEKF